MATEAWFGSPGGAGRLPCAGSRASSPSGGAWFFSPARREAGGAHEHSPEHWPIPPNDAFAYSLPLSSGGFLRCRLTREDGGPPECLCKAPPIQVVVPGGGPSAAPTLPVADRCGPCCVLAMLAVAVGIS